MTFASQLYEVGAMPVAIARGAFGIDRDRPVAGGKGFGGVAKGGGVVDDVGHAVA